MPRAERRAAGCGSGQVPQGGKHTAAAELRRGAQAGAHTAAARAAPRPPQRGPLTCARGSRRRRPSPGGAARAPAPPRRSGAPRPSLPGSPGPPAAARHACHARGLHRLRRRGVFAWGVGGWVGRCVGVCGGGSAAAVAAQQRGLLPAARMRSPRALHARAASTACASCQPAAQPAAPRAMQLTLDQGAVAAEGVCYHCLLRRAGRERVAPRPRAAAAAAARFVTRLPCQPLRPQVLGHWGVVTDEVALAVRGAGRWHWRPAAVCRGGQRAVLPRHPPRGPAFACGRAALPTGCRHISAQL